MLLDRGSRRLPRPGRCPLLEIWGILKTAVSTVVGLSACKAVESSCNMRFQTGLSWAKASVINLAFLDLDP